MIKFYQWLSAAVLLACLGTAAAQTPDIAQLRQQAAQQEDAGNLAEAIAANQRILCIQPDDVPAMSAIAGLYGMQQQYQQEIAWADRVLAVDAGYAPAYISRGNALAALGRHDDARAAYQKATEIAPDNPLGPYSLGLLAEAQGQTEQALQWYQQSIRIDPEFENGWLNAAVMYASLDRKDEAITALQKMLGLAP